MFDAASDIVRIRPTHALHVREQFGAEPAQFVLGQQSVPIDDGELDHGVRPSQAVERRRQQVVAFLEPFEDGPVAFMAGLPRLHRDPDDLRQRPLAEAFERHL